MSYNPDLICLVNGLTKDCLENSHNPKRITDYVMKVNREIMQNHFCGNLNMKCQEY